jgi:hypothetical protein
MNWSATAVGGGGVEIKPLSQEEALARQDEGLLVSIVYVASLAEMSIRS